MRAPEGTALDATEIIANRIATRVRQLPEVEFTLVTVADDPARTQNLATVYVRLKPVCRSQPRSVRGDERRAREHPAQGGGREPAHRRAAGRHDRRRRQPERRDSVHDQRAGPQEARAVRGGRRRRGAQGARGRRRRYVDERRQARAVGRGGPAEGLRPRRAGLGCGRGAAAAGRRRPGHDLQRRRRAVRSARPRRSEPSRPGVGDRPADGAVRQGRQRAARQPGAAGAGDVAVGDQPAEPSAAGDDLRGAAARRVADRADGPDDQHGGFAQHGAGLQHALRGALARARPSRAELPDRVRPVDDLHVSDPRGAVRVVAAPDHDPAVAAADAAIRAAVAYHHWTVAEHLLSAGLARAVRRREEELHPADRPREPAARPRHGAGRGHPAGQPRPAAADPDDHVRVRGRHDPAGALERRRLGDQPRDRLRHHRRAVARAVADSRCHARGLLTVRRRVEDPAVAVAPRRRGRRRRPRPCWRCC